MGRLVQCNDIVATTSEVNTATQATNSKADDTYQDSNTPNSEGCLIHAKEVIVLTLHEVLREACCESLIQPLILAYTVLKYKTCEEYCCEE